MWSHLLLGLGATAYTPALLRPAPLSARRVGVAAVRCQADWTIDDGIVAIRENNGPVLELLTELRTRPFFRMYAADLLAGCSYMQMHEVPCELDACEVDAADEVPDDLRARDDSESDFELDSWARWDMPSDFTEYYDLGMTPEGNTGYDGSDIWRFIHKDILFQKGLENKNNEWKLDFNRVISGLHSSVSAQIIADIEKTEPELALDEYRRRLRDVPTAVENLHFCFMIVLCAIKDAQVRLDGCGYLGDSDAVQPPMRELTSSPLLSDENIQRAALSLREHASTPTCTSWKLRMRTRDLLRVMNCVQCNLCRLHGKISVLGISAAMQVLLGLQGRGEEGCNRPPDPTSLHRVEVAAMVTVAGKLSAACALVERLEALDKQG